MVKAWNYLGAFFSFKASLAAGILLKWMQLSDIGVAAGPQCFSRFFKNVIKVGNMFQYKTEAYKIVFRMPESSRFIDICLNEIYFIGADLFFCLQKHFL